MCYGADSFASGDCTGSLSYPFEVAHRMVGGNTIGDAIECVGEQCNLSFVVVEKGSYAITIFNGQWKLGLCGTKTLFSRCSGVYCASSTKTMVPGTSLWATRQSQQGG